MRSGIVQNVALNAILGLLLFLPAGTIAWPQAWIFLALFNGCSQAVGLWLLKTDPELLAERMRSPLGAGQRPRDRQVMGAIVMFFGAWIILIALDARGFRWSQAPLWAEAIGALLIIAAFWGFVTVLRANRFAASTVRLQQERGQTVISTGPYAYVRHPMYAYAALLMVGMPLLLGSLWGLVGVPLGMMLIAARALGEEALLVDGLPGYRDYVARVPFRLLPGVW